LKIVRFIVFFIERAFLIGKWRLRVVIDFGQLHWCALGVFEIEQNVDRFLPAAHPDRLVAQHGSQRGDPLLTIKQQLVRREGVRRLGDVEVPRWRVLIGFPHEDRARRVAPVQRVNQVPDAGRPPDVPALHFGET
jgi:hypothetical protein